MGNNKINKNGTTKKRHGLLTACQIVALVYLICNIIVLCSCVICAIVGIVLLSIGQRIPGIITLSVGLSLTLICSICVGLCKPAWSDIKQDIVKSKGLAIANCIFNIPVGVLMIIIWNKKQAGEIK